MVKAANRRRGCGQGQGQGRGRRQGHGHAVAGVEALEGRTLLRVFPVTRGGAGVDAGGPVGTDRFGNVYVVGTTDGSAVDFDATAETVPLTAPRFVAKYDNTGALVWARSLAFDQAPELAVDREGNVYLAGAFGGRRDFNPKRGEFFLESLGGDDLAVVKLSTTGNLLFARQIGGEDGDQTVTGIALDAQGGMALTGQFTGTVDFNPGPGALPLESDGASDAYVLRLSGRGKIVWARQFDGARPAAIAVDGAGAVVTTGRFTGTVDFDPGVGVTDLTSGAIDAYLLKLDATGDVAFAQQFGTGGQVEGEAIVTDVFDAIYVGGTFTGSGDFDPSGTTTVLTAAGGQTPNFLVRVAANGAFEYGRQFGSGGTDAGLHGLTVDKLQNVYAVGEFAGTADFDPSGATENLTAAGGDAFLLKLDSSGNFGFVRGFGGGEEDAAGGVAIDRLGNLYVAGAYGDAVDFDPGAGTATRTANGPGFDGRDFFLSRFDPTGGLLT